MFRLVNRLVEADKSTKVVPIGRLTWLIVYIDGVTIYSRTTKNTCFRRHIESNVDDMVCFVGI